MLKSVHVMFTVCLGFMLVFGNCSKDEISITPTEKMPITTNSQAALQDYHRGLAFADKLQRNKAAEQFKKAVEKDPTFALAWLNLAFVSAGPNQFMANLDSAKACADQVSEAEQLQIQAAEYDLQNDNTRQANALNRIAELFPGDERIHLSLGTYYFGLQQFQSAIKAYSKAIAINENMAAPYNMLGYSQRSLGNYGEAEKAFKFYIKLNPANPNAFDSYAELLLEMGRPNESIEFYKQALGIDSTFGASYLGIATNYNFMGEHAKAREQLQLLREISQNYIVLRQAGYAEAVSYVCEGKYLKAIECLRTNIEIASENNDIPNMAGDLTGIGNIYLELGQAEEASLCFKRSVQLINDSGLQQALVENARTIHLFNMARYNAVLGDFTRAEQLAEEFHNVVVELNNPTQLRFSHLLNGTIALHKKEYQVAIDEFEQTNQLDPYNLYRIGLALEGQGKQVEADIMKQRAAELNVLNNMNQAFVLSKTRFKKQA